MATHHELDKTNLSPPVCPYTPSKLLSPCTDASPNPLVNSFGLTPDFNANFNADFDADSDTGPKAFDIPSLEDSSKKVDSV